jgi:hypothetical protein
MKTYAIGWKCTATGRIGTGSKLFEKEDADRLAMELNESYPDIDHEAVVPPPPSVEPASPQVGEPENRVSSPEYVT